MVGIGSNYGKSLENKIGHLVSNGENTHKHTQFMDTNPKSHITHVKQSHTRRISSSTQTHQKPHTHTNNKINIGYK